MEAEAFNWDRLVKILLLLLVVAIGYQVVRAIINYQTTGLLVVTSSDTTTQLSVSQDQKGAVGIGTGSSSVRLRPGTYYVAGRGHGLYAAGVVRVAVRQKAKYFLNLHHTPYLPNADNVTYYGLDALLDYGVGSGQLENLKIAFFQFDKKLQTVTVPTGSINVANHDPNSASTSGNATFTAQTNDGTYTAHFTYALLGDSTELQLVNQAGVQVFDSGSISSQTPGGD